MGRRAASDEEREDGASVAAPPGSPASEAVVADSPALAERYGRTKARRAGGRLLAWIAGGAVALVLVVWVVWAGLDGTNATIATQDTAHEVLDDHSVRVEFDVTVPTGSTAGCVVQALNDGFAVVGWKIVELPASDSPTRSFTEIVRTSELASTGLISSCWLT
ncbi:DUF4307 domain-containing protein [Herbiconiux sp. CPCC 205716]|uniref:DUF4307 domain-containing protein n=1 Tax=Herbiconiux gentiana TaxID=2970912 RepID=A0ABT2GGE6_9MICO|nr:DUF4307 domain-containing protein [Herbiconiux gentiana]MCS5715295.1 DUF4307 domain-containing protein [Herbiconiux gentiana]